MRDFSNAVRAELARLRPGQRCCAWAELAGVLRAGGSLHLLGNKRFTLSIQTEHADVARKIVVLLRSVAGLPAEVVVEEHVVLGRRRTYHVQPPADYETKRLLIELGILDAEGRLIGDLPSHLLQPECCRASFLRGAYLMRGSVCDPRGNSYHLEIVASTEDFALGLCYLLNLARLKAHLAERKQKQVVYLKDADDIAGFLSLVGANARRLEFEEVRVLKEVRGGVNRLVNAETANLDKSAAAAVEQIRLIEALQRRGALADLPEPLRAVAEARLANPEATLAELGRLLAPPLSKSAVNHRFRGLRDYAREILGDA
ncbi:MAG: DNA-binding protein WhiA [Bacteroidota bacterium]